MKLFYRIWCFLLLTVGVANLSAQNGINSPFSQYGIGNNNMPYNFPGFAAIGGVTLTQSSHNMVNPFNPASYGSIGMESFVFDMGLNLERSKLTSGDEHQPDGDGNLGYLAVGFPILKWWKTALGVIPLSEMNYETVQTTPFNPGGEVSTNYWGVGSVTQFFWGNGFNLLGGNDPSKQQLRVGFNINLLYGNISRTVTYDFGGNDTTYFMNSSRRKNTEINNFTFDFGAQYERPLGEKYRFAVGLSLKPHQTVDINENALVYTFVSGSTSVSPRDTIFPLEGDQGDYTSTIEQPLTLGLGLSLQRNDKWLVATDFTFAPWSNFKYTENGNFDLFGTSPLRYDKNQRYALALQLLGDKNSTSYFRRITFSAGVHYESGKLSLQLVNGDKYCLNEWGFGFGATLPMRKGRSRLNLSVSYSSFGDKSLLCKDALMFGISIGSCETWFVKRKFN